MLWGGVAATLLGRTLAQPAAVEADPSDRCKSPRGTFCSGRCVNIHSNDKHCGKCGNRCKNNEFCRRGDCRDKNTGGCGNGDPCLVFVTSEIFGGAIGGLNAADGFCQRAADRAELPGKWRAWLSNTDGSPSTRFKRNQGQYVLTDETTIIAADWTALTSGSLQNPINIDENGTAQTGQVFTNTATDGTPIDTSGPCGNFEVGGFGSVTNGNSATSDATWTDNPPPVSCLDTARMYCFQQS